LQTLAKSNLRTSEHIFIIDDNDAMAKFLNIILTNLGYSTYVYSNAFDFLKAIPQVNPSILITDMNMPHMSGVEVQAELVRLERMMPVIFISGKSTVHQSITAMKQGAVDFLLKPVLKEQLISAVESAFKLSEKNIKWATNKASLETLLKNLAPREREVYELMVLGFNNNEIVKTLTIALPTAKQYKAAVMCKLQIKSLSELINLQSF